MDGILGKRVEQEIRYYYNQNKHFIYSKKNKKKRPSKDPFYQRMIDRRFRKDYQVNVKEIVTYKVDTLFSLLFLFFFFFKWMPVYFIKSASEIQFERLKD